MTEKTPQPTVDPDHVVGPDPSEPESVVGDEGGAAPIRSPRIVENDDEEDEESPSRSE